jgi:hypothetical protein
VTQRGNHACAVADAFESPRGIGRKRAKVDKEPEESAEYGFPRVSSVRLMGCVVVKGAGKLNSTRLAG